MKQPYRILVVDDEPDLEPLIKLRMRRKIRSGVYSFEFAENGVEALEVLKHHQDIDIVVTRHQHAADGRSDTPSADIRGRR